jgi:hypothetical protein
MLEIEERVEKLLDKMLNLGMEFSGGQHALVCKDGVVILNMEEDGVGIMVINNRMDINFRLGISDDAVKQFKTVTEVAKAMAVEG